MLAGKSKAPKAVFFTGPFVDHSIKIRAEDSAKAKLLYCFHFDFSQKNDQVLEGTYLSIPTGSSVFNFDLFYTIAFGSSGGDWYPFFFFFQIQGLWEIC